MVHLTSDTKQGSGTWASGSAKLRLPADTIRSALLGLTYRVEGASLGRGRRRGCGSRTGPAQGQRCWSSSGSSSRCSRTCCRTPTRDEAARAKNFRGNVARLSEAGEFWVAVADVPKARARASALAYQRHFDARIRDAQSRLDCVVRASDQVCAPSLLALRVPLSTPLLACRCERQRASAASCSPFGSSETS